MNLSAQLHDAIMGPEAAIALAALATAICGSGVKALYQIAKGLGSFEARIGIWIEHSEKRFNHLEKITEEHDDRLRQGKL
jgi:hypothetical protein